MSESFVMYRSFHEALKELTREQYGNVMYAINEYALNGTEPTTLNGIEKAIFLMAKPQLDANRQRRENGAQGGRPRKENEKPMVNKIENQEKPMVNEIDENEKPNVNANENENEKVNVNTHTESEEEPAENACVPSYIPDPYNPNQKINKNLAGTLLSMIQKHNSTVTKDRKVPVSNNVFNFCCKEMRELIAATGPGASRVTIQAALENFLKVCQSDTWMKSHSWSNFCKHYTDYTPEFFTLERYLNAEPQTDDASKKPENAFFFAHKDDPEFHVETFQAHIDDWKAEGRPDGAAYLELQNKWEAENVD